jgi:hypothetical protein
LFKPTRFTLHQCRVCVGCFQAGARASRDKGASLAEQYPPCRLAAFLSKAPGDRSATPRCAFFSKSMAKALFLLSDAQLAAMPALRLTGEAAKRSGVAIGADPKITLVTSGCCVAAAVERYGSEDALREEAAARLAKSQAAYDAKSKAAARGEGKPPGKTPGKECCNFPHLNQTGGCFTHDPTFGLVRCQPRNSDGAGGYSYEDDEDGYGGCG